MIIENGLVLRDTGQFEKDTIYIENGRIADSAEGEILNAEGLYIVPGLIDIHLHGCRGYDVCDATPEALKAMAEYQLQNGITAFYPATMALPLPELKKVLKNISEAECSEGAVILGINLEGTFLAPGKAGAQKTENLQRPDLKLFRELQENAGGRIKLLTIAPELSGAMDFIRGIQEDVRIAVGHTGADYDIAAEAFNRGAAHVTHLFNAMKPMGHREPGVPGAALDAENVMVELIADGEHIHPAMVRAAFEMFGEDRIILISDSMRACGMPEGEYTLGGQMVQVKGKRAVLADGTLAGSVCHLMDMVRGVVKMGIPLGTAIKCAGYNPAKALGILPERGSLRKGCVADVVLLDKYLNIRYIIQEGRVTACE